MTDTPRFFVYLILLALLLPVGPAGLAQIADLSSDTRMATSDLGDVVFSEVADQWPFFGSDLEKIRIVHDALKNLVYAWEADEQQVRLDPEKTRELELAASMEVLFLKQTNLPEVTEEEIRSYYQDRRNYYYLDDHLYLRFIRIDVEHPQEPQSRRQAQSLAIEALAKLRGGADFVPIAEEYSAGEFYLRGRRLGPVPAADIPSSWGQAVLQLDEGQYSDVVELPDHFLIVKLVKRVPAGYRSLDDVRPAIRARLEREKAQSLKQDFFTDLIRSMSVNIDHQAIADPTVRGNKTVIQSKILKMSRDEFLTWADAQTASVRRSLRDPIRREMEVRRNLLLSHWVEDRAARENLKNDPRYQQVFQQLRRNAVSSLFEEHLLKQNPSFLELTEDDIRQYYFRRSDEFRTPEKAEIRDIIVKAEIPPGSGEQGRVLAFRLAETEARQSIQKIKNRIVTFEMEALKFGSTLHPGGYFFVEKGMQGEIFDEVVFNLQPGAMTEEPVLTSDGYRVVQLRQKIPATQKPLEHVREDIANRLKKERLEHLVQRLEKSYFEKHNCRILEENFLPRLND